MLKTKSEEAVLSPEFWLEEHGDYLYGLALRYVKDPSRAEEILQDGLLSAYKARESFQRKSSLKTWLSTIVRNKALDYLRRASREKQIFSTTPADEEVGIFSSIGRWKERIPSWGKDPEEALTDKGMQEVLAECVDKLSSRQRAIFTMRVIDGHGIDEVCQEMEISPSNASVILYRARLQLRDCLEKNWFNS